MDQLKIALLQISPCGSLEGNLEKGIKFCRQAKKMGADIALFPEMWSCGYDIYSGLQMNGWRMQYRQTALLWTAFDILQGNSIWQSVSLCSKSTKTVLVIH